jgi:hypothetical protein
MSSAPLDVKKINAARFHAMRCKFGLITQDQLRDELRKLDWHPDDDPAIAMSKAAE